MNLPSLILLGPRLGPGGSARRPSLEIRLESRLDLGEGTSQPGLGILLEPRPESGARA